LSRRRFLQQTLAADDETEAGRLEVGAANESAVMQSAAALFVAVVAMVS